MTHPHSDTQDAGKSLHGPMQTPERATVDELARAGDWEGVRRAFQEQAEQQLAELEAERQERANARRASPDPYQRAMQARLDGDEFWRDLMPTRWHISRWWDIHSVPLAMTTAIIGGVALLWWWLT